MTLLLFVAAVMISVIHIVGYNHLLNRMRVVDHTVVQWGSDISKIWKRIFTMEQSMTDTESSNLKSIAEERQSTLDVAFRVGKLEQKYDHALSEAMNKLKKEIDIANHEKRNLLELHATFKLAIDSIRERLDKLELSLPDKKKNVKKDSATEPLINEIL